MPRSQLALQNWSRALKVELRCVFSCRPKLAQLRWHTKMKVHASERVARSARRDGHNINASTVTTGRATAREFRYSSLSACCDLRAPRVQSNRIFRDAALVQLLLGRYASPESLKSFRFPN